MIARETRVEVVRQIDRLLVGRCGSCETRAELYKQNGAMYARTDGYCNRECPVGKQLQELGKHLVRYRNKKKPPATTGGVTISRHLNYSGGGAMHTALFEDKHWEKHGDFYILVDEAKIPAAIFIPIADPETIAKEMKKRNERIYRRTSARAYPASGKRG